MKARLSENVKNAQKSTSAKIAIIPGGLTKKLQPLDVRINRSFIFLSGMPRKFPVLALLPRTFYPRRFPWSTWCSDHSVLKHFQANCTNLVVVRILAK